jgi:hypothetical protein
MLARNPLAKPGAFVVRRCSLLFVVVFTTMNNNALACVLSFLGEKTQFMSVIRDDKLYLPISN